jgi:hypothetical protein
MKPVNATFKILRYSVQGVFKLFKVDFKFNEIYVVFPQKGPCDVGQWFVLKDVPKCELIPEGCPADGEHVYGTMRTFKSSEASKCWKIGSPCSKSNSKTSDTTSQFDVKVAQVEQSEDGNLHVFCDVKKYYVKATSESSVGFKPSCNAGTYRSRFDKCARGFWG